MSNLESHNRLIGNALAHAAAISGIGIAGAFVVGRVYLDSYYSTYSIATAELSLDFYYVLIQCLTVFLHLFPLFAVFIVIWSFNILDDPAYAGPALRFRAFQRKWFEERFNKEFLDVKQKNLSIQQKAELVQTIQEVSEQRRLLNELELELNSIDKSLSKLEQRGFTFWIRMCADIFTVLSSLVVAVQFKYALDHPSESTWEYTNMFASWLFFFASTSIRPFDDPIYAFPIRRRVAIVLSGILLFFVIPTSYGKLSGFRGQSSSPDELLTVYTSAPLMTSDGITPCGSLWAVHDSRIVGANDYIVFVWSANAGVMRISRDSFVAATNSGICS